MEVRVRSALPFMLIALVLGVLFGLLLGWQVWPVTWYNTDPSDLRVEHQKAYILMAAQAYAQTGNAEQTRLWLAELTDEDTSWAQVANLVERVAREREAGGDAGGALLVRRMAQALQMPSPTAAQFQEPQYFIRFSDHPLMVPVVAIALVLLIAIAIWLLLTGASDTTLVTASPLQARPAAQTHTVTTTTVTDQARPSFESTPAYPSAPVVQRRTEETEVVEPIEEPIDEDAAPSGYVVSRSRTTTTETRPPTVIPTEIPEQAPATPLDLDQDLEPVEADTAAALTPVRHDTTSSELPPDTLGAWEADYAYGDDDFDCNFTIETSNHEFLGECGVGIADYVVGEGPQKVQAFEIWLFDKGDIRTVRQILVSAYAYNDAALNARLAEKGDVIMVQPGAIIPLETQSLAVTATVQEFAYLQDEEKANAYFERLRVELIAERNDQLA